MDGIKAVARASEGASLIIASDLNRPKLDGSKNSLTQMVNNAVLENEAIKYRLIPTPEETEKQYGMIAQSNNKTIKQLDEMVALAGITPQEARREFSQMNAINSLIGFKVTGSLIVPESEVIAYYNDHPELEAASYYIDYVFVPFNQNQTPEEQLKQLEITVRQNDPGHLLRWGQPFWIQENAIATEKAFIMQLMPGQISTPLMTSNGFELYRLHVKKAERIKPLEERYSEIVNILRKPKYLELLNKFQQGLLENVSIIYFDIPI